MTEPLLPKSSPVELALEMEEKPQQLNPEEAKNENEEVANLENKEAIDVPAQSTSPIQANDPPPPSTTQIDPPLIHLPTLNALKSYEPTIEFDTYNLSALLSGLFIPCTIAYMLVQIILTFVVSIMLLFLPCCFCFKKYYQIILKLLSIIICLGIKTVIVYLLLVPGIFVVCLQIIALKFLEEIKNVNEIKYDDMLFLKVGIVIIYICMISKELSQGLNTFFYIISLCIKVKKNDHKRDFFFGILSLIMPLIQIMTTFFLCRISIQVILGSDSTIDIVQNFAGLYVILEFDNIMYSFLSLLPWRTFLQLVITIEISGMSINNMANSYLKIFLKDLLNLQSPEDNNNKDEEKNPLTNEEENKKEEGQTKDKKNKEFLMGEDQDDFKFNYNEAFGERAKFIIGFKVIVMVGLILFWLLYYVARIIVKAVE
jgi:hypothetical protein